MSGEIKGGLTSPWPKHLSGGGVVLPPGSPVCSGDKWLHSDGRVEPMDGGGGGGGTFLAKAAMSAPACPRCAQLEAERDALRAAVRAYLAAREQMGADDMPEGSLDGVFAVLKEAEACLLALLPPEAT